MLPELEVPVTQPAPLDSQSGPLVLARIGKDGKQRVAVVADEDPPSLRVFDTRSSQELWSAPLDGRPGHVVATKDGRVFVAIRERDRIDVVRPETETVALAFANTCVEPIGLALSRDEETLYVACGWSHELIAFSVQSASIAWRVDLPLEPRAAIATGRYVVVSHASGGRASIVDIEKHAAMTIELRGGLGSNHWDADRFGRKAPGANMLTSNGFALAEHEGKVYAPMFVSLTARGPDPAAISYYGTDFQEGVVYPIAPAQVSTWDDHWLYARVVARRAPNGATNGVPNHGCLAPRGVAVREAYGLVSTYVACPGNDQLIEHGPNGDVARRILVAGGPSAVAIDTDNAFVWSQRARLFSTVDIRTGAVSSRPANGSPTASALLRRGAQLFAATDDGRITRDGRGCASCHPDGRADGLTWSTPEGPRQTALLAGRLEGTAPYGWSRQSATVKEYIGSTIHRLGGRTLDAADLDALTAYVMSLAPPRDPTPSNGRGKRIFESTETGCASCHQGALLTDRKTHDIHSAASSDRAQAFDTPSLRFIGNSAPYFHDGRYATLHDLLTDPKSQMGRTSHLGATDLAALEAYLHSL